MQSTIFVCHILPKVFSYHLLSTEPSIYCEMYHFLPKVSFYHLLSKVSVMSHEAELFDRVKTSVRENKQHGSVQQMAQVEFRMSTDVKINATRMSADVTRVNRLKVLCLVNLKGKEMSDCWSIQVQSLSGGDSASLFLP